MRHHNERINKSETYVEEEPVEALRLFRRVRRKELAAELGKVQKDVARLKHAQWLVGACFVGNITHTKRWFRTLPERQATVTRSRARH